ncbi:Chaperone protein dnaJ 8, chloroplastic, partial [Mucuna pruriens]
MDKNNESHLTSPQQPSTMAAGVVIGNNWLLSRMQLRGGKGKETNLQKKKVGICCSSLTDSYNTLRIQPGASKSEVKKAFRHLALQYHPDVCRGSKCGVVMSNLRGELNAREVYECDDEGIDEAMRGMNEEEWEMWEEWMGWEGAGIPDYSSHINPYI